MPLTSRIAGAAALLAAASMAVTPAAAAELPLGTAETAYPAAGAWDGDSQNAENHRYRRYRRDRGIDAGDVIAGVVILGGIAAIASAASRNNRDRDYRRDYPYRDGSYRDRPYQYRPYRGDSRYLDSRGIDRAVDMCVRAVERDVRIQSVDSVDRLTDGWRVEGSIYNGEGFSCRIGNDGRIEGIDYGQRAWDGASAPGAAEDRQWDDEAYAEARRDRDDGAAPAYPGGPVDEDIDADVDDGRYQAAQAPDFGA